ncbi:MAG: hypothetical protein U0795_24960 [Pirellulales bacterium]
MLEKFAAIAVFLAFLWALGRVLGKAGYSPWWCLLVFIPVVNLLALFYFAVSEWPIEKERQLWTAPRKSPRDAKVESHWEIKRLAKRVTMLERLAVANEPDEADIDVLGVTDLSLMEQVKQMLSLLRQLWQRTTDDNERAFVEALMERVKRLEDSSQSG